MERCCFRAVHLVALLIGGSVFVQSAIGQVEPSSPATGSETLRLANLERDFRAVVKRVAPSVVAISGASAPADADDALRSGSLNGEKLNALLSGEMRTVGTGFVVDSDGYILTNEHVVAESEQLWVTTDDHKAYPAFIVGSDPRADLAILKIPRHNMVAARFADSQAIERGMWTIALGNPYGLAGIGQMSMSVGVVSATQRSLTKLASQEHRLYTNLIQTTAEINPGNSGGPLFDLQGNVIGVSTAVILPNRATNGIGFALPITPQLLQTVADLKAGREVKYSYLGVMVSSPTDDQLREEHLSSERAVSIDSVEPDSPAANILKPGDLVTHLNDQTFSTSDEFVRAVGATSSDEPAKFIVHRDGQTLTLMIRMRNRELPSVAINRETQRLRWRGMLLGPIPSHWTVALTPRPKTGLMVVGIEPDSPMAGKGVHSGTIITSVAGKPVNAVADLQDVLDQTQPEQCAIEFAPDMKEVVVSGE